jgi:hypothetical protein
MPTRLTGTEAVRECEAGVPNRPDAERLIELGWAEFHNIVTRGLAPPVVVMVYGPRDEHELAVVKQVVELAYLAAGGAEHAADGHAIGATAPAG